MQQGNYNALFLQQELLVLLITFLPLNHSPGVFSSIKIIRLHFGPAF